jgi:Mg/Co/Ni transporter MgtE
METSKNHVYYVVDEAEQLVRVVAIHGAIRGDEPDLSGS